MERWRDGKTGRTDGRNDVRLRRREALISGRFQEALAASETGIVRDDPSDADQLSSSRQAGYFGRAHACADRESASREFGAWKQLL